MEHPVLWDLNWKFYEKFEDSLKEQDDLNAKYLGHSSWRRTI